MADNARFTQAQVDRLTIAIRHWADAHAQPNRPALVIGGRALTPREVNSAVEQAASVRQGSLGGPLFSIGELLLTEMERSLAVVPFDEIVGSWDRATGRGLG